MMAGDPGSAHAKGVLVVLLSTSLLVGEARSDPVAANPAALRPVPLEEIVVIASKAPRPRHSIPARVTRFDGDRLALEQAQQLADISRYEPALEAEFNGPRFGATGVSIRGIGGNRVALEVDGVPLPQQYAIGSLADASRLALDPTIVDHIEILRGPASTLYGSDAIAGVITVDTLDGAALVRSDRSLHTGARAGWFGENDAALASTTLAWGAAEDSALAAFSYRNGHEPRSEARNVARDDVDFEQWQGFGKWTHDFGDLATLRLVLDYFERNSVSEVRSLLGTPRFLTTTRLEGDDQQRRDRQSVHLELPGSGWLHGIELMAYRQSSVTRQDTSEERGFGATAALLARDFELRELDYGGELRMLAGVTTGAFTHVLVAGVEWDHMRLVEQRDGGQFSLARGIFTRALLGEAFPVRDLPRSEVDELGIYWQDEVSYGVLTLTGGLRWDDYSLDASTDNLIVDASRIADIDADQVTARAGATLRVLATLQVYAHYAEGFRAPPAGEVNLLLDLPLFNYRALPNPDLEPERSQTIETGLRWSWAATRLEAALYHTDFDDFIESRVNIGPDPVTGGLRFQSRNLTKAHIYGIEAELIQGLVSLSPALRNFTIEAGFHAARGENDVTGRALNDVQPLKAVFGLTWRAASGQGMATVRATHLGHQGRVDFSTAPFFVPPAATVVDFIARWQPRTELRTELGVYNLGNERYWRYADVRQLALGDPRAELAARPGCTAQISVALSY